MPDLGDDAQYVLAGCAIASLLYVSANGFKSSSATAYELLRGATLDKGSRRLCGVPVWAAVLVAVGVVTEQMSRDTLGGSAPSVSAALHQIWTQIVRPAGRDAASHVRAAARASGPSPSPAASVSNVYIVSASDGSKAQLPSDPASDAIQTLARVVGVLTGTAAAQKSDIDEIKASMKSSNVAGQLASVRIDMTKLSKQQLDMKEAQYMDVVRSIIDRATAR